MKKILFVVVQFFLLSAYSQDYNMLENFPKTIQPSPEAASLGRYGDIPVSHFTGVPGISIPIYTIKSKNLEIPITVSYHASGIKVNDKASSVGLGWVLNAGGCITRNIKDMPDGLFKRKFPRSFSSVDLSEYFQFEIYAPPSERSYDSEPDVFSYNFLGYSGEFVLKEDMKDFAGGMTLIHSDLKITYWPDNYGFEIKTPDGYRYLFADVENGSFSSCQLALSGDGVGVYQDSYAKGLIKISWFLSSIISPTGQEIKFKYKTGGYMESSNISFTQQRGDVHYTLDGYVIRQGIPGGNMSPNMRIFFEDLQIMKSSSMIHNQLILSEILFEGGSVTFLSTNDRKDNPTGFRLYEIQVKTKLGGCVKKTKFYHNYFYSDKGGSALISKTEAHKYRLKLLKINDILPESSPSSQEQSINEYKFDYNKELLPCLYSLSIDWQGYYNGQDGNTSLLPRLAEIYQNKSLGFEGVSREPNFAKMQACILKTIHYPTGGYTNFEYENHQPDKPVNVGGLRIKKIQNYDTNNIFLEGKEYKYGYNRDGKGKLNAPDDIFDKKLLEKLYTYQWFGATFDELLLERFPHSIHYYHRASYYDYPAGFSPYGNLVSYPYVYEYNIDKEGNSNGYTFFQYGFICDDRKNRTHPYEFVDLSVLRGNLLTQEIVDKTGKLLYSLHAKYKLEKHASTAEFTYEKRISNSPNEYEYSNTDVPGSIFQSWVYSHLLQWEIDSIYSYSNRMISKTEEFHYPDNTSKTTTEYEYDDRISQPVKIRTHSSTGDELVTEYEFPFMFPNDSIWKIMSSKYQLPIIGEKKSRNTHVLEYSKLVYRACNANTPSIYYPSEVLTKKGENPDFVTEKKIHRYDGWGNPIYETTKDGVNVVYLWSYNGQYPIAEIKNITYQEVESALSSLGFNITELAAKSFLMESDFTKINQLRSSPSLAKAMLTTYFYDPLVGLKSVTDINGVTKRYIYDRWGRLEKVFIVSNGKWELIDSYKYNLNN